MNKDEAARFLGIGVRTLEKLVAQGRLAPVDNSMDPEEGRRARVTFSRPELDRYLRENSEKGWARGAVIARAASPNVNRSHDRPLARPARG